MGTADRCQKYWHTPHPSLGIVVLVVIFFAYPSAVATAIGENPISRWGGGDPSGGGFSEWLETLTWMRYNTPDPGLDYLAVYDKPANNKYPYPDTAYGVMSWWDYGHVITYWHTGYPMRTRSRRVLVEENRTLLALPPS